MDALSTALSGMVAAENQLTASASDVAQMTVPGHNVDIAKEMVDQVEAKQQFTASAQVVKFSNDMWRSLIEAMQG